MWGLLDWGKTQARRQVALTAQERTPDSLNLPGLQHQNPLLADCLHFLFWLEQAGALVALVFLHHVTPVPAGLAPPFRPGLPCSLQAPMGPLLISLCLMTPI